MAYRRKGGMHPLIHGFGTWWRLVINHVPTVPPPSPILRLPVPIKYEADQTFCSWLLVFSPSTITTHVHGFRAKFWSESNSSTPVLGSWHTCKKILENAQPFCWVCNNKMVTVRRIQSAYNCFTPPSCKKNEYRLKCKCLVVLHQFINYLISCVIY
jgi:hypothetical protein